jgi:hypothetical protein
MIGAAASNSAAIAAVTQFGTNGGTQQALSAVQSQARAQTAPVSSAPAATIVSEVATPSANGIITWQITYADGTTSKMTTSGPIPSSTQRILV